MCTYEQKYTLCDCMSLVIGRCVHYIPGSINVEYAEATYSFTDDNTDVRYIPSM